MDVALISPVSPFDPSDGHRLAMLSDVNAVIDNGLRLGVISFTYDDENNAIPPLCPHKVIPARGGSMVFRFFRSMLNGELPPSAERLYCEQARREIRETLLVWHPSVVIIDDVAVSGYIPLIRDILPRTTIILRSHNVMQDVRLEQWRCNEGAARSAMRVEYERYVEFERRAIEACDGHWAITKSDAARMTELYHRPTGYLTVSIPLDKYASLRPDQGRSNGFVHVGTLDFRRRSDLHSFLNVSWPRLLHTDPGVTLTLAGALRGSAIPARNVMYSGRVVNDHDVYRLGRFALNFQSSTGGLKLKTLTSMAAGRTLISTAEGVEGLRLESGCHYWDIDEFISSPQLKTMLEDFRATQPMADAGRQYVTVNHCRSFPAGQLSNLLQSL
jgi:hypothetical protein